MSPEKLVEFPKISNGQKTSVIPEERTIPARGLYPFMKKIVCFSAKETLRAVDFYANFETIRNYGCPHWGDRVGPSDMCPGALAVFNLPYFPTTIISRMVRRQLSYGELGHV